LSWWKRHSQLVQQNSWNLHLQICNSSEMWFEVQTGKMQSEQWYSGMWMPSTIRRGITLLTNFNCSPICPIPVISKNHNYSTLTILLTESRASSYFFPCFSLAFSYFSLAWLTSRSSSKFTISFHSFICNRHCVRSIVVPVTASTRVFAMKI